MKSKLRQACMAKRPMCGPLKQTCRFEANRDKIAKMQWIEILSSQTAELQKIGQEFGIHPLALEDCFHRDQRAKLEDYGTHQFLVWFMCTQNKFYELQFLIFPDKIVFVPHDAPPGGLACWKDFFQLTDDRLKEVPQALFFALDRAIDLSFEDLRNLIAKIESFEQKLFKGNTDLKAILPIKKKLASIELHMGHLPLLSQQLTSLFPLKNDLRWKFRDLRDHCQRLHESVIFQQSQIISSFELHWAMAAQRTNLQIKKLTLLASISVPTTFWASFWGMNFQIIPYDNPLFFAGAMVLMFGTAVGTYFFLKRQGYWSDD
jgi:magnesium transporter